MWIASDGCQSAARIAAAIGHERPETIGCDVHLICSGDVDHGKKASVDAGQVHWKTASRIPKRRDNLPSRNRLAKNPDSGSWLGLLETQDAPSPDQPEIRPEALLLRVRYFE
jgi:hypothetical protein